MREKIWGLDEGSKIEDILFYVMFTVLYLRQFYRTTMFTYTLDIKYLDLLGYAAAAFLLPLAGINAIRFWRNNKRLAVILIAFLVCGVGSAVIGKNRTLIILCVLIVSSVGRKFNVVAWIALIAGAIMMVIAYFASIGGYIRYFNSYAYDGRYLHAFGILYHTDFAAHVLYLSMIYVWIRRDKMHFWEYLILWCVAILTWRYSGARMNAFCLSLFLLLYCVVNIFKNRFYSFPRCIASCHLICTLLTFLLVLVRDKLSSFPTLYHRLQLSDLGIKTYGVSLFGQYIEEMGAGGIADFSKGYFFLDIAYVRILLMYGVAFLVVFLLWMTLITYHAALDKDVVLCLILCMIAFVSIIEHHSIDYCYNVFFLAPAFMMSAKKESTQSM